MATQIQPIEPIVVAKSKGRINFLKWSTAKAIAITTKGRTTTVCLPGHHHPCMVKANHVAVDQPIKKGKMMYCQLSTFFLHRNPIAAGKTRNEGVQAARPNPLSTNKPINLFDLPHMSGSPPMTLNSFSIK